MAGSGFVVGAPLPLPGFILPNKHSDIAYFDLAGVNDVSIVRDPNSVSVASGGQFSRRSRIVIGIAASFDGGLKNTTGRSPRAQFAHRYPAATPEWIRAFGETPRPDAP